MTDSSFTGTAASWEKDLSLLPAALAAEMNSLSTPVRLKERLIGDLSLFAAQDQNSQSSRQQDLTESRMWLPERGVYLPLFLLKGH